MGKSGEPTESAESACRDGSGAPSPGMLAVILPGGGLDPRRRGSAAVARGQGSRGAAGPREQDGAVHGAKRQEAQRGQFPGQPGSRGSRRATRREGGKARQREGPPVCEPEIASGRASRR